MIKFEQAIYLLIAKKRSQLGQLAVEAQINRARQDDLIVLISELQTIHDGLKDNKGAGDEKNQ